MRPAPIALFVYNRPRHTQRLIEALQQNPLVRESELHIFSDAPKGPEASAAVSEVRSLIRSIRGFKSVDIVEREQNFGLARSVIDGVTSVINQHGRIIVLEDDLLVAPGFLEYMNRALEKYANEERVMQVSGYLFPVKIAAPDDVFLMPLTTSWGWGTWQRAWQLFDADAAAYVQLMTDSSRKEAFDLHGAYPYFNMLERQLRGEIDSWAIRWWLTVFMNDGLVAYPRQSLVDNSGFDGSGVHCGRSDVSGEIWYTQSSFRFPERLESSAAAYEAVIGYLRKANTGGRRAWIRKYLWWLN